ncbi:MAG: MBL fold metallo-hydrolase [bacterium]|nr:MBL fold metallo-hydrolase [bacterium]
MIIERTMSDNWLSNTWLVADKPGGHAVLVDTGGPMGPIVEAIEAQRLEVTHVLCTHHHIDHVQFNAEYKSKFGCPICGHRKELEMFGGLDVQLDDGDELVSGGLHIRSLHVPGHTVGQLSFVINDARVFTGDTLFRGTVGGTRAPGHAAFEDIRHSIMEILMRLPKETQVYPGHMEQTTIGAEWEQNPFVRLWRGVDSVPEQRCMAFGQPATLLLRAQDYDGGWKCWVRFDEGNKLDIVPGSQVAVE